MKISFHTLGCKVNQNETSSLIRLFCENGYTLAQKDEIADIYVVNSCTVTDGGDKKSKQILRRAKRENPNAVTVLTGCFPQAYEENALKIKEADIITGSGSRAKLLLHVENFLKSKTRIEDVSPYTKTQKFEELPAPKQVGKTRGFIKVQDGCDRRCAYCIIPYARGKARSRDERSILEEIKQLASENCAEVVLTGINLSAYGQDTNTNIATLVEKIAEIDGVHNIRLGSLEPDLLPDDIITKFASIPKLCPQFHLALQSGCDKTLRNMYRPYSTEQFSNVMQNIRKKIPEATFITDVIVGFPGESDADFAQSVEFMRKMRFLKVHVFGYSKRKGTKAYDLPCQIDKETKALRVKAMQESSDEIRSEIIKHMHGKTAKVLLENNVDGDIFTGYTREYVPVFVEAKGYKSGDIVSVVFGEFDGYRCKASLE